MQSSSASLDTIVARYAWLSTFSHPPDVLPLLSTNDPPSFQQSIRLNASVERLNAALSGIQSDLDILRRAVASLEVQMSRLLSLKHECKTILSPIRHLPTEIIIEILRCTRTMDVRCSDTRRDIHRFGFNVFVIENGPWCLGHVCSLWRYTIENLCPELWSTMTIEVPSKRGSPDQRAEKRNMVQLLERVLERTRDHQLDFCFENRNLVGPRCSKTVAQCFSIMLAHSSRWRRAKLVITPSLLSRISLIRGKLDLIEDAYLKCSGYPSPHNIDAFAVAPNLKSLHLENMHRSAEVHFPTANLVSFFDGRPFSGDRVTQRYLHYITSSPNLVSFSWHHHSDIPISSLPYYPLITHPTLRELSACSGKLLHSLISPSLTKMALGSGHEDLINIPVKCPPDALSELHDLLVRSQCSLTVLSLVDAGANEQLSAIIALCPHLRDLSIEFNGWTSDDLDTDLGISSLISRMSETHVVEGVNRHILVPDLESLAIKLFSVSSEYIFFIDRQFVKMVVSRVGSESRNPSQLKKLCMTVIGSGWDWDLNASSLDALFALDGNHGFNATLFLDHGDIDTVRTESGYSG
ncbi:hypothetical protein ARMGADRAFT_1170003 [Armillaria gallica]|uniref:F-box domain-containing protein n=1 Tax=Armillaria gallica TaxID=47427 RepID=A0A2H3CND5_ARMGA|nr:hypothetical protein ARMGADRAFT_1170003 [Armillaria gallica]